MGSESESENSRSTHGIVHCTKHRSVWDAMNIRLHAFNWTLTATTFAQPSNRYIHTHNVCILFIIEYTCKNTCRPIFVIPFIFLTSPEKRTDIRTNTTEMELCMCCSHLYIVYSSVNWPPRYMKLRVLYVHIVIVHISRKELFLPLSLFLGECVCWH